MAIRVATTADVQNLAGVQLRSALAGFAHIFPESIPKPTRAALELEWAELVADTAISAMIVEADGSVAGALAFGPDNDPRFPSDAVLLKLYVVPEHTGRGLGSTMHDRAVDALVASGHRKARLWVLERNLVARRMYERRGWTLQRWSHTEFPGSGILELGYTLELGYSSAI